MAHGHDGGHADLQQLGGDGLGRLFGLRGLAGFEEDERDAVIAQQRAELVGVDGDVPALLELADVLRVLEAQPAEADACGHRRRGHRSGRRDTARCAPRARSSSSRKRRQRGRAEDVELHEAGSDSIASTSGSALARWSM